MRIIPVSKDGFGDDYFTPDYVVEILLPYLQKHTEIKSIWCPCDLESSEYVKVLRANGYTVHNTHISLGQDFLTYEPDFEFDCIITNPPFSLKNEVIERCIHFGKPWALLLSGTLMQSASFIELLAKARDINFIIFDKRISYNGQRPSFSSWYYTHGLLDRNEFYIYKEDPKIMYDRWQQRLSNENNKQSITTPIYIKSNLI